MNVFPEGYDLAWLAVDASDRVAVFTNAGVGPVPSSVFTGTEEPGEIEEMILRLPERNGFHLVVEMPRPDSFVAFARRGVFAYDWRDVHRVQGRTGCYEIMCCPTDKIKVGDLGGELAAIAWRIRFESLCFDDSPSIAVEKLVKCWPR